MPRKPRYDAPGTLHHVTNRGIDDCPILSCPEEMRYFISRVVREQRRGRLVLHSYSLLATRFDLLVESPLGELSEAMRRIQNDYSRYFNRRHHRDGTLFRGRFHSMPVESGDEVEDFIRGIDALAEKAGVASQPWDHYWSSAWSYARGLTPRWLETSMTEQIVARALGVERLSPGDYLRFSRWRLTNAGQARFE